MNFDDACTFIDERAQELWTALPLKTRNDDFEEPEDGSPWLAIETDGAGSVNSSFGGSGKSFGVMAGVLWVHHFCRVQSGVATAQTTLAAFTALFGNQVFDGGALMFEEPQPANFGRSADGTYYRTSVSVGFSGVYDT